jgi:hypothetical protein
VELAVHVLVGTALFALVAVVAVLLSIGVRWLDLYLVDRVIVVGITAAEYAVFIVDMALYSVFLYRTALRTTKRL